MNDSTQSDWNYDKMTNTFSRIFE